MRGPVTFHFSSELESAVALGNGMPMSSVQEIESALTRLSIEDLQAVRDWLDDFIEDRLEVSDEFKAKIQRAQRELAGGIDPRNRQVEAVEAARVAFHSGGA
jgi:hypothetical protein